jgi:hypothetical protein
VNDFFISLFHSKGGLLHEKKILEGTTHFLAVAFVSVLGSTAYTQEILWVEYDDFETVSKSNNLWQLGAASMCSDHNPYFGGGKMFQEAAVPSYNPACSPQIGYPNRVRSWASPLAAPYITGIRVRVTLDQYTGYDNNLIRGRLGAIFYNDGGPNSGNGTDLTSEVFAALDIRPTEVRWYVLRLTDQYGVGGENIAFGQLFLSGYFFPPPPLPNLKSMPFDFKLWFDGTKLYSLLRLRNLRVKPSKQKVRTVALDRF